MRLSRSGFILIAVSSVTCVFAAALLFALRPRPITSHADAIATILDRRSIVYERVTTDQVWPAAVNYYAYGPSVYPYSATVSVRLPDDTIVPGSLECADDRRRCRVTIARFGIDREPIPDISSVRPLPWTEWLRQVIQIVRSFGYVTFVSNVLEKHPQVASFQVDRFSLTVFQNNDTIPLKHRVQNLERRDHGIVPSSIQYMLRHGEHYSQIPFSDDRIDHSMHE